MLEKGLRKHLYSCVSICDLNLIFLGFILIHFSQLFVQFCFVFFSLVTVFLPPRQIAIITAVSVWHSKLWVYVSIHTPHSFYLLVSSVLISCFSKMKDLQKAQTIPPWWNKPFGAIPSFWTEKQHLAPNGSEGLTSRTWTLQSSNRWNTKNQQVKKNTFSPGNNFSEEKMFCFRFFRRFWAVPVCAGTVWTSRCVVAQFKQLRGTRSVYPQGWM